MSNNETVIKPKINFILANDDIDECALSPLNIDKCYLGRINVLGTAKTYERFAESFDLSSTILGRADRMNSEAIFFLNVLNNKTILFCNDPFNFIVQFVKDHYKHKCELHFKSAKLNFVWTDEKGLEAEIFSHGTVLFKGVMVNPDLTITDEWHKANSVLRTVISDIIVEL